MTTPTILAPSLAMAPPDVVSDNPRFEISAIPSNCRASMTTIYLDTEFTELADDAILLSVGAVTEAGAKFYAELPPPERHSAFVCAHVLPLFEGGDATCTREEFPARFADWLRQWPDPVLVVESRWDIFVLRKELEGSADNTPGMFTITAQTGPAVQVQLELMPPVTRFEIVRVCAARHDERRVSHREHHALDDALVFRAGALACRAEH